MADYPPPAPEAAASESHSSTSQLNVPTSAFKRGHTIQPSVGNAASLFGDGNDSRDDPFASISSQIPPSIGEENENQDPIHAHSSYHPAQPSPSAGDLFGGPHPNTQPSLHVPPFPDPNSAVAASPDDLFSQSNYNDDWLNPTSSAQHPLPQTGEAAPTAQPSADWLQSDQQAANYPAPSRQEEYAAAEYAHQHGYHQGSDGNAQYTDHQYYSQGYQGQGYDPQAYANQSSYDGQAYQYGYSQPQTYELQQQQQQHQQQTQPMEGQGQYAAYSAQQSYGQYAEGVYVQDPSQTQATYQEYNSYDQQQWQPDQYYDGQQAYAPHQQHQQQPGPGPVPVPEPQQQQQDAQSYPPPDPYAPSQNYYSEQGDSHHQNQYSQQYSHSSTNSAYWQADQPQQGNGYEAVSSPVQTTTYPAETHPYPNDSEPLAPQASSGLNNLTSQPPTDRAPSPYDPVPVANTAPSVSAPPSQPIHATIPPPPKGPPRGPSRNTNPRQASFSSSSSSASPEHHDSHPTTASVDAAESGQEAVWNDGDQGQWPPSDAGWNSAVYGTRSGWIDSLEQAAATPPARDDGPPPPLVTVTDQDTYQPSATLAAQDSHDAEASRNVPIKDPGKPGNSVDEAANAFQDLTLDGPTVSSDESIRPRLQTDPASYRVEEDVTDEPTFGRKQSHEEEQQPFVSELGYDDPVAFDDHQAYDHYPAEASYGDEYGDHANPDGARYDSYSPSATYENQDTRDPQQGTDSAYLTQPSQNDRQTVQQSAGWGEYASEYGTESTVNESGQAAARTDSTYDPYAPSDAAQTPYENQAYTPQDYPAEGYFGNAEAVHDSYAPNPYGPAPGQASVDVEFDDTAQAKEDGENLTPNASNSLGPWTQAGQTTHDAYDTQSGSMGLERQGTITQRSYSRQSHTRSPSDWPRASAAGAEDNSYGLSQAGSLYGTRALPETPSKRSDGYGSSFESGAPRSSLQLHHNPSAMAGPASPYDPSAASAVHSYSDAPSHSDMLETMRSTRIPLVCFGIGGKVVSYFPTPLDGANGVDDDAGVYGSYGYANSGHETKLKIQTLSSLVPSSSYASAFDPLQFPGPAFDGSSQGTSTLSRATGAISASKAKKAALIKHLEERIQEISAGVGYLRRKSSASYAGGPDLSMDTGPVSTGSTLECQRVEDKVLLLQLLKLILEHDAQTTNNPAFDAAVRNLLTGDQDLQLASNSTMFGSNGFQDTGSPASGPVLRTYQLRSGFLVKLKELLLQGKRKEAAEYAIKEKMWAHAMAIASCVDKECWKSVVSEFIRYELGSEDNEGDLQSLKVAYSVFSGQDPASVFDLFRTKDRLGGDSVATLSSNATSLQSWKDSAAIVALNKNTNDSAALTAIGDGLATRGLTEAAHFCYMLSPQTSPFGGVDTPAVRFTLLGASNPKTSNAYLRDLDSIIMTEILEFAYSLVPVAKGQDPYPGLAHVQAYRLIHAYELAELGDIAKAQKYCEAIAISLKLCKTSPYLHRTLLSQLKGLSDRLCGAPQLGSSGNWMTRKMQRPTLDGVWGALEGRFTKFIAGEGAEGESESPVKSKASDRNGSIGPFSHYSAITPDAASGGMTRQQSFADFNGAPSVPTSRAGSAMDFHHPRRVASPKNRASSAMAIRQDWRLSQLRPDGGSDVTSLANSLEASRNNQSLHVSEYSAVSSTYGGGEDSSSYATLEPTDKAPWYGHDSTSQPQRASSEVGDVDNSGGGGYGYSNVYSPEEVAGQSEPTVDGAYYGYQSHGVPKPQFYSNIEGVNDESGFVSPIDALSGSASRTPQPQNAYQADHSSSFNNSNSNSNNFGEDDEDDDLGLGNSHRKKNAPGATNGNKKNDAASETASAAADASEEKREEVNDDDKKPQIKPSASWFGRLWSRSSSADLQPKAKKAHLGEETAFYYDKDLQRWVNKKVDASPQAATPPMPPPRAQTTSPAMRNTATGLAPPMRHGSVEHVGGGGVGPPRTSFSSFLMGRATPPISEGVDEGSSGLGPPRGGAGNLNRARSNLADHSIPPASQPVMRPPSTTMSPPPPPPPLPPLGATSRTGTIAKKRPIKSRYVVVD